MAEVNDMLPTAVEQLAAGRLDEAERTLAELLNVDRRNAETHHLLGLVWFARGRLPEAADAVREAIRIDPSRERYHVNLGAILQNMGKHAEAAESYRSAVQLDPSGEEPRLLLGSCLKSLGRIDAAMAEFHKAVATHPNSAEAQYRLGQCVFDAWNFDEGEAALHKAVELDPKMAKAHVVLGQIAQEAADVPAAIAHYRRVLEINPNERATHETLLVAMHYPSSILREEIFAEHRRYAKRFENPARWVSNARKREANARVRIGFVSGDFRLHPVGSFALPVVEKLDRARFEVTCYSNDERSDAVTKQLRSAADRWRGIQGVSADKAAEQIRADSIDILVDLAGYTTGGRPDVFALKPAPVQVAQFAYPDSSGLEAMDYRVTDALCDPPGETERFSTEKLLRLPGVAWCWRAVESDVNVGPAPVEKNGFVTFGCMNNPTKLSEAAIETFARVLVATPDSRLLIRLPAIPRGTQQILATFESHGVDRSRITPIAQLPRRPYLARHNDIDIALDPFPYNGGVTTCDALWMGVPVISLAGDAYVSRQGVMLLKALNVPELIAPTREEYVNIAARLSRDPAHIKELRGTLRQRLQNSPVMNERGYVQELAAAYQSLMPR